MAKSAVSHPEEHAGERLQRVLAARGVASRRQAEALIQAGRVTVDGQVVTELGTRVAPDQSSIRVDGRLIRPTPWRYLVLNKPSGYLTTMRDERDRRTVMDLVPKEPRVFPVGRLDRDTEGLLLLTNDGDLANRVMHPRYGLTKEYVVLTPSKPSEATMQRVRTGVVIDGKRVIPHVFRVVRESPEGVQLSIVLHEGMNRVVRRMMDAVGIPVHRLRRERIGPLSVAGITRGAYRELTDGELASLLEALHLERAPAPATAGQRTPCAAKSRVPAMSGKSRTRQGKQSA